MGPSIFEQVIPPFEFHAFYSVADETRVRNMYFSRYSIISHLYYIVYETSYNYYYYIIMQYYIHNHTIDTVDTYNRS